MGLEEQCVIYDKKRKECSGLMETYCRESYDCAFYKSRALYKKSKRTKSQRVLYPLEYEYRKK